MRAMNFDALRHYLRGHLFAFFRRRDAAVDAYREALAADPGMVRAARVLGYLLAQRRDFTGAEMALTHALRAADGDAATWFNLAYVQAEAGRSREAIESFRRALALNPKLDRAWYGLGYAQAALGEHAEAAKAFEEAAVLQGMNGHAWYALGMAHHHCLRPDKVAEVAEHLARFDPQMASRLIRDAQRPDLAHLVAHLERL